MELIVRDDDGNPDAAKEAAAALVADGVVAIIGPTTDASAVAVTGDPNSDSSVPLLTLTPAAELAGVESDRLFNVVPLATVETVVLANLAREAKLSVACVIQEDAAASETLTAAFRQAFELKGGQLRAPIIVTPAKVPDYASVLGGCLDD
jgi:ABC-type branched-subunit amino acid transport system substrate-binding protein